MDHTIFKGSAAAVVTPMKENGEIDYKAMEHLLEFQIKSGTDAIVVNGTTGESSTLEDWEKLELIEFTVKVVNKRIPVIAGTGSNHTAHAVTLSAEAEKLGADGLLVVTPYYNKTSQSGLTAHFLAIADSVNIPILLYNVPSRTCVNINPETCLALSSHPNIRGIKEASGNISQVARIAALCGETFDIYSGNDDQAVPVMSLGGLGVISVLANIMPEEMHKLCKSFLDGYVKESKEQQLKLLETMNAMFLDVNPMPVKAALSIMGLCGDTCRLPLTKVNEEDRKRIREVLKQ